MDLTTLFKPKEAVQVIDPSTRIWEPAKILGLESSWAVRISYDNWKYNGVIAVDRNQSSERWEIRKPIKKADILQSSSRRRSKDEREYSKKDLGYNKEHCQLDDEVYFVGTRHSDQTEVQTLAMKQVKP